MVTHIVEAQPGRRTLNLADVGLAFVRCGRWSWGLATGHMPGSGLPASADATRCANCTLAETVVTSPRPRTPGKRNAQLHSRQTPWRVPKAPELLPSHQHLRG